MSDTARTTRQRAWITTAEVCEWLRISRETLRQLRLQGVLPIAPAQLAGTSGPQRR